MEHIDDLDAMLGRLDEEIERRLPPFDLNNLLARLDEITGVGRQVAQIIVAEVGTDMSRFANADHLVSWAGLAPGNNERAGKRYSGKTRKGIPYLRNALVEAAHAAARTKNTYLAAQYRHIAARHTRKRALVALAHTMLTIIYYILKRKEPYRELGGNYFDERDRHAVEKRLVGAYAGLVLRSLFNLCLDDFHRSPAKRRSEKPRDG